MIKSEMVKDLCVNNSFPKLLRSIDGDVVLFSSCLCGTVVHPFTGDFDMGHSSSSWNMSHFVDFNGKLTLSNGSE